MKNFSIVMNVVLFVAVCVLFYLHFSSPGTATSDGQLSDNGSPAGMKIAYINSDTVLKYYDYLKVNKAQLEAKTKKMDQDYRNRLTALQSEIAAYQRNVNSMTLGQVRATEEDLTKKQQNLQMFQQTLGQQLMEEESRLNRALYERVTAFLKEYGQGNDLHVVLKFDPTSDVLYGSPGLDITQDVIKGLNESYLAEKSAGTNADTTKAK